MAKKITVKMLKDSEKGITPSKEIIEEFINSEVENNFKKIEKILKMKVFPEDILKPLDVDDERVQGFLASIGVIAMFMLKDACTPAAWKYMAEILMKECIEKEE